MRFIVDDPLPEPVGPQPEGRAAKTVVLLLVFLAIVGLFAFSCLTTGFGVWLYK